jgi:uncharacterized membrane protein YtjA (UPF0391 family)
MGTKAADARCDRVLPVSLTLCGCAPSSAHSRSRFIDPKRAFVPGEEVMLHYAIVFFVIAIIAAVFGFGGIAAGAVGIAKVLFFIFIVLFLISLITGLVRRS